MLFCKIWVTRQNILFRVRQMEYDQCYQPKLAMETFPYLTLQVHPRVHGIQFVRSATASMPPSTSLTDKYFKREILLVISKIYFRCYQSNFPFYYWRRSNHFLRG
jgi:hypothetical protein